MPSAVADRVFTGLLYGGHAYGLGRPHQAILTDAAPLLLVAGIT